MFNIKIISYFSAAHFLKNYKGKCEALHGHNWKVEVVVAAEGLNDAGMVMDFSDLKCITDQKLKELDHKQLNEVAYFREHNPSSEEIAKYIFLELKTEIETRGCYLCEVRVWETDTSCALYTEDKNR